jgi:uncharacterized protein YigA (DUF484 family)
MSTVKQRQSDIASAENAISDDLIVGFLEQHPEFFEQHQDLLGNLNLPHSPGGPAVSLIERQVTVLRQQNQALERQLKELVDVARSNDQIAGKIHALAIDLLAAADRDEIVQIMESQLRNAFNADRSVLVLFDPESETIDDGGFLRITRRDEPAILPFKTFMESRAPRCGRVRDAQRDYLFGIADAEIGSVALVPLGERCEIGFVAIGSRSADHFHPGKSIDFLSRLGDLLTAALRNG